MLCVHSSIDNCRVLQPGTILTYVSQVTQSRAKCLVPMWTQEESAYFSLSADGLLGLLCNYRTRESWRTTQCRFLTMFFLHLSVFLLCCSSFCNWDHLSSRAALSFYWWATWEWKWGCPIEPCERQKSKIGPDDSSSWTILFPWVLERAIGCIYPRLWWETGHCFWAHATLYGKGSRSHKQNVNP